MTRLVSYELDDHVRVQFETDPVVGWREVGVDEVIGRIGEAVTPLVDGAAAILSRLKGIGPDDIEIKFGVKVSGTANWVIAKAATEGNFEVTLKWSPSGRAGGTSDARTPAG